MRAALPALALVLTAGLCGVARAGDEPFGAWKGPPIPTSPEEAPPDPLDLQPADPLDSALADLIRRGQWVDVALALARAGEGAGVVRGTTPGVGLVGVREDVRRRVGRLPQPARDAYHALADARAQTALRAPGERREAALADLLDRWGADAAVSSTAARLLGERLLERGDVAGAALLWRRALDVSPDRRLEARLLGLRAHLGLDRVGSLGAPAAPAGAWGVRWARRAPGGDLKVVRPVIADGSRIYLTDSRGVLALDREDGRLVWRLLLHGDPRKERLALGHGRLLLARRDRLLLADATTGALVWERRIEHLLPPGQAAHPSDRLLDVAATPAGFVALATLDGERVLLGVAPEGRLAFETRLWQSPGTEIVQPRQPVYIYRRIGEPDETGQTRTYDGIQVETPPVGPGRRITEDGRLAAIGDRVVLTADGLVACASALSGGLLWLRDWSVGREVAGERVLVGIAVGPYAVEAVTAAGALVRLDPLDGSSLPRPQAPDLGRREGEGEAAPSPYVLTSTPLVLGWLMGDNVYLTSGVPARTVLRLALGPLGPGAVSGQTLCYPDAEGVVVVDLGTSAELGVLPWTFAASGPLVSTGGLIVAAGPEGIVVYGPGGGPGGAAPPPLPSEGPAALTALDSPDWRVRLQAYDALSRRATDPKTTTEAALELARGARGGETAEARDIARELLDQVERRRVFASLPTKDRQPLPTWLLGDLAKGVSLVDRLRALRNKVETGKAGSIELERHLLVAEDPLVRLELFVLLLKLDEGLRDRVSSALADTREQRGLRLACARALVTLAAHNEGPSEPLASAVGRIEDGSLDAEVLQLVIEAVQALGATEVMETLIPQIALQQQQQQPPAEGDDEPDDGDALLLDAIPRFLEETKR